MLIFFIRKTEKEKEPLNETSEQIEKKKNIIDQKRQKLMEFEKEIEIFKFF